jgi:DNA-directed RNA polymerase specialized sigma24 family protein
MTVHQATVYNPDRPFSEYAQEYLDCLEWREPQLEALLRRAGFSKQLATDAVQDATLVAYRVITARKVESLGKGRWPWLIRVAFNKAIDLLDSRWSKLKLIDPHDFAARLFAENEADEDQGDRHACVRKAFAKLRTDLQQVAWYVIVEGHTYSEAQEHFHITRGSVACKLRTVRNFMRTELEPQLVFLRTKVAI